MSVLGAVGVGDFAHVCLMEPYLFVVVNFCPLSSIDRACLIRLVLFGYFAASRKTS